MRAALIAVTVGALGAGAGIFVAASSTGPRTHPRTDSTTRPTSAPTTTAPPPVWRVAWGSAMAWGFGTASNATIRDLATIPVGGQAVRLRISNAFGSGPLALGAATVGLQSTGATVVPGSLHPVTFNGAPTVTIPAGSVSYSDPVALPVTPGQVLSVSIYVSNADLVTVHPCCTGLVTSPTASYFTANGAGDLTGATGPGGFAGAGPWERLLDAVDVLQTTGKGSIVVVGDSITDGFNSTLRWTDVLQKRIDTLPPDEQRAVVNEGITANTLTDTARSDATTGGGPPGLSRLSRDALSQAGVSEVVLFLGTNDLWFGATAQQVIAGLQQAITMAHSAGVRIYGVTLLPREAGPEPWSPAQQAELEQVNQWILTSGSFDGTLNFATAVADIYNGTCSPTGMFPPYDSGDHLHPNAAGETAMANAVDTVLLGMGPTPPVPPLVAVTPTPNCAGVPGIPAAAPPSTTTTAPPSTTTTAPPSTTTTAPPSTTTTSHP